MRVSDENEMLAYFLQIDSKFTSSNSLQEQ